MKRNNCALSPSTISPRQFKMIKIIERILVTTDSGRKVFFPCEIQILTKETHASLKHRQTNHSACEKRQVKGAGGNGTDLSQNTDASRVRLRSDDWGTIRECLGGFAACGLLRESSPNHPPSLDRNECHGVVLK